MYVVVEHRISDPAKFWESAQAAMPKLPADVKCHQVLPSPDGARAVCLWEAASIARVRDTVETHVGDFSKNEYFEVNPTAAMGLPSR